MDYAEILANFRKSSGKSQKDFAELLGLPQTTWAGYELGKTEPKLSTLILLAEHGYKIPGLSDGAAKVAIETRSKETGLSEEEIDRQFHVHVQNLAKDFPLDTPIDQLPKPDFTPPPETEAAAEPPAELSAKEKANTRAAITMLENAAQSIEAAVKLLKESMGDKYGKEE